MKIGKKNEVSPDSDDFSLTYSCLDNIPVPTPDLSLVAKLAQGQILDANSQCRLYLGASALFSQVRLYPTYLQMGDDFGVSRVAFQITSQMCSSLYCAASTSSSVYVAIGPAMEGTSCGSGQVRPKS